MQNLHKKIELFSNIAIIIVAILFGAVLVNRYLVPVSPKPLAAENNGIKNGMKLALSDVDWSKSNKTLVMVLSTSCHFCAESVPFYQKLAQQKVGRGDVRLLAVMPQSIDEAQRYFKEKSIPVDEVRQANLNDIYVRGTPTLIVVDQSGLVVESWVGKLPPEKEIEVIQHFFGERANL